MSTPITIITALCSFSITAILAVIMIPFLRKLKFGQTIREDGPSWHASKQGTPTMGGIVFIAGSAIATIVGYIMLMNTVPVTLQTVKLFCGLIMALCFGIVGFIDDYIKVVKKRNLGLTAKQKIILQVLITAGYLAAVYFLGDKSTSVIIPFFGTIELGFFYYLIMGILIIGIVNSANLTDGIDGLLGSVTFVVALFFMIVTGMLQAFEANVLATALGASLIAFLIFNLHPAKVFMGDTGSFYLGGLVVALAFAIDMPLLLFFVGFIYCLESLSVILQIISVKTRKGKKLFLMSPIHHHFEMKKMSENKIVIMFCSITAVMCIVAYMAVVVMK